MVVPAITSVITGVLTSLHPPRSLVFVAKGWCSCVWVALLLEMPVACVYLESGLLAVFTFLFAASGVLVKSLEDLEHVYFSDTITLVVSGPISFVQEEWARHISCLSSVLWVVEESLLENLRSLLGEHVAMQNMLVLLWVYCLDVFPIACMEGLLMLSTSLDSLLPSTFNLSIHLQMSRGLYVISGSQLSAYLDLCLLLALLRLWRVILIVLLPSSRVSTG